VTTNADSAIRVIPGEDLRQTVEAFLAHGDACGPTAATRTTYAGALARFQAATGLEDLADLTPSVCEHYLADLRTRIRPVSCHQAFRVLRTFARWCQRSGRLAADPMAGLAMRAPKTLPRVPDDDAVSRLLAACPVTPEGRRNRALIALLADSGLRKEELRRLRWGDLDLAARTIRVHTGKGQKDGMTFFGETTASLLRTWRAAHPAPQPAGPVCCTRDGTMLGPSTITHLLHRLSRRAGLATKIGPHALRHYAATSLLRRTGDLELVRRVLRHESLAMTLGTRCSRRRRWRRSFSTPPRLTISVLLNQFSRRATATVWYRDSRIPRPVLGGCAVTARSRRRARGRPVGTGKLADPKVQATIIRHIRAGAFDWVAAQAAGVSRHTFWEWVRRGEGTGSRPTAPIYARFANQVRQAAAKARVEREVKVADMNPLAWLRMGPGRSQPGEPGWTDRHEITGPEGAPLNPEPTMEEVCRHVDRIAERFAERDRQNAVATTDEVDPASNEPEA